MEIEERGFFRVTRDADFEVSDEADDLLEALQTELRRRPFGDVVRLEVSESMSDAMLAQLKDGLRIGDDQVYPVRGLIDMSELSEIANLDRPELKFEPLGRRDAAPVHRSRRAHAVRVAAEERRARAAPVRLVRLERRGVRRAGGARSAGQRAQDDRLSDERRVGARAGADRGGGERQAGGVPRRAEGSLRRAAEHPVVAAGSSRRASTSCTASRG